MKSVIAYCAVLTFACCAPAMSAPGNPFDRNIPRPPGSIPHARGTHVATPLPRPKPVTAPRATPVAAPTDPLVFPPVAPLE